MKGIERYLELGLPEKTLRVGFAPAAPDGSPSNLVTIKDGDDKLLATMPPDEVRAAAYEMLLKPPADPVSAKEARALACFALAILQLRPELLPRGSSPAAAQDAGAAHSPAAPATNSCEVKR